MVSSLNGRQRRKPTNLPPDCEPDGQLARHEKIAYAELAVTTNFSFLRGASHPEELVAQAITLGLSGLGIADRNSLAGVVRGHSFLRENKERAGDFRYVVGTRLVFCDGTPDILVYPRNIKAYGRLTRLLSDGKLRTEKGQCILMVEDLFYYIEGQQLIVMDGSSWEKTAWDADIPSLSSPEETLQTILHLAALAEGRVWLAAAMNYTTHMRSDLHRRIALAQQTRLPLVAVNDVVMHVPERRKLADVVTCIRMGQTLESVGTSLAANAERHLKPPAEMARLFEAVPEAIGETMRFLAGLDFSLNELQYNYPYELREGFASEQKALEFFTWAGAEMRYPHGIPSFVSYSIWHELNLVAELNYAAYFLTVHDIIRFARERTKDKKPILCQGRGSAANSTICYCLGITEVDPTRHGLLFERFISTDRNEPPDIDVDFEHERREEVMQYIYEHYGRERAALTATVITYRTRSAIRDVGKVFGYSEDSISTFANTTWGWQTGPIDAETTKRLGFDPREPRLALMIDIAGELTGFPRHLSQHTGGFVITRTRLDEVTPIANAAMAERTTIEWDKDDLDALRILKIDVLSLGMLSCLRRGFDLLKEHYDETLTIASVPGEERCVYDMISRADTLGVFQIESRAQMSMLPRLKPEKFYDLVIEVAIVRPGPIQGDMVHPYLRRRQKLEDVDYPSKLESVLKDTLGIPLFQEQAMKIAIVAAGFTPSEADKLRRAMATFKRSGTIDKFEEKMTKGMVKNGYPQEYAERCFAQIKGFGTYGFPESHAASFAILVYVSAWIKCRYPDVFACALLNSQPMGFYAPAQIVRDAREHGVEMCEVDINASEWDCTLEAECLPSPARGRRCRLRQQTTDEGNELPECQDCRNATECDELCGSIAISPDLQALIRHASRDTFSREREKGKGSLHPRHASMQDDIRSTHAVRLGFREINGLREDDMTRLVAMRGRGYDSVRDLWLRTGLMPAVLERLAEADAFRSIGLDRREALWAVRGLNRAGDKDDLPLFRAAANMQHEPDVDLPPMLLGEHVVEDYRHLSLSLKAHPVAFVRSALARRSILKNEELAGMAPTSAKERLPRVTVSGLVLVRQRPGTGKGVIFMTIEDETGIANVIVWPKVFERLRPIVIGARFVAVTGRMQRESDVIHVIAERIVDLTSWLGLLARHGAEHIDPRARVDEAASLPEPFDPRPEAAKAPAFAFMNEARDIGKLHHVLPKGRNFH